NGAHNFSKGRLIMTKNCIRSLAVLSLFTFIPLFSMGAARSADPSCIRTRAAFDVGSSSTKMKVFKINICTSRIVELVYPSNDDEAKVATVKIEFKKDLIDSIQRGKDAAERKGTEFTGEGYPRFGEDTMIQAEAAFAKLKANAERFHPSDY